MENKPNTFTSALRDVWLPQITGAIITEKSAVLSSVAASAFYASYNMDDAKKELHKHFVSLGYFLPKRPSIINEKMRRVVDAALVLVEKEKEVIRSFLSPVEDGKETPQDGINKMIDVIAGRYTPGADYPLNIGNKFLPMLADGWSLEQCLASLAGDDTSEEEAGEAALDAATSDKEEKEQDSHADKIRKAGQAFTQAVLDTPARDGEAYLLIHAFIDTFARAALKANGVYDVVNQSGVSVTLGMGDDAVIDRLAIEYGRATSYAAGIKADGAREQVIATVTEVASAEALEKLEQKHGKKNRKAA